MNQKLILVLSLLIGIMAFGLSIRYFHSLNADIERAKAEFAQRVRRVEVVVAQNDIPQGLALEKKDIARNAIYEIELASREDVVTAQEAAFVLGRKTLFNLKRGEPLRWSYLEGGSRAGPSLASSVTPGMRAMSLAIGGAAAVSGLVQPNDRVDVLGTFMLPAGDNAAEVESVTLTEIGRAHV